MDGPAGDTDPNVAYTWGYGLSGDAASYARLEKVTLPGGRQVYYNYEDANAFMSLGRVGDIADGSSGGRTKYVAYSYLGASMVVDANHPAVPAGLRLTLDPNADKTYWGYDRLGRVIDQKWARSAGSAADRFAYTYDRGSNRLTRSLSLKADYNETYHYDFLDRLKDANRPGDSGMGQLDQSWTLRPTGNWSSFISAGVEQTREHNNANEITSITRNPIDPPDPLYDQAGCNVFGPKPNDDANAMHFRYDAWNRLSTIHLDDGDTSGTLDANDTLLATYRYDGLNRRVMKVTHADANTTGQYMYHNESWQVVEIRRGVNQTPTAAAYKQYVWDIRYIDAPVCRWWDDDANSATAAKVHYFTNDGNFNTTALVDANSGGVVERYLYDPYGKPTFLDANWAPRSSSSYDNDILYCGYWYDPETGLYHVRERYYDPVTGTWKTRDLILYPDGMNLYEYVLSSPVSNLDATGESSNAALGWLYVQMNDIAAAMAVGTIDAPRGNNVSRRAYNMTVDILQTHISERALSGSVAAGMEWGAKAAGIVPGGALFRYIYGVLTVTDVLTKVYKNDYSGAAKVIVQAAIDKAEDAIKGKALGKLTAKLLTKEVEEAAKAGSKTVDAVENILKESIPEKLKLIEDKATNLSSRHTPDSTKYEGRKDCKAEITDLRVAFDLTKKRPEMTFDATGYVAQEGGDKCCCLFKVSWSSLTVGRSATVQVACGRNIHNPPIVGQRKN